MSMIKLYPALSEIRLVLLEFWNRISLFSLDFVWVENFGYIIGYNISFVLYW